MKQALVAMESSLLKMGIKLCGRFADFEYLNMDACVERGMVKAELIDRLIAHKD